MPPNQSSLRCLRSSTSLNRTPGNPTCHVETVLRKMIGSIVLALLLFCQSINAGRCLRVNGTHDEISEAARRHRLSRSLTFPDPSMLLVCNWSIDGNCIAHFAWHTNCSARPSCITLRRSRSFIKEKNQATSRDTYTNIQVNLYSTTFLYCGRSMQLPLFG